jgi:hypothetical protein
MGANSTNPGSGRADVGWPGSYGQQDANNRYLGVRVRSGMFGNVLGFGLARKLTETTTIKGYVALWSTVESLGRDKWSPLPVEAREGYFTVTGPLGSLTVGRMMGWLGRASYEIDVAYGHGYGLGLPCTDSLGPACGHIGTGAIFPGYSAGIAYSTPSAGGFQLHFGLYDPIVFSTSPDDWSHASFLRPEGALTLARPLGSRGRFKLSAEGLYQPLARIRTDDATGQKTTLTASVWGLSGGARLEIGPLRLGGAAFRGRGLGLYYALQRSAATADDDSSVAAPGGLTYQLRMFTGFYGQAALVFGRFQIGGGYGLSTVDQLPVDRTNPNLSVIRYQAGFSVAAYFHVSDSVVVGVDFFRFMAGWYGAPIVDANTMQPTGQKLAGERQALSFLNGGVTYHW